MVFSLFDERRESLEKVVSPSKRISLFYCIPPKRTEYTARLVNTKLSGSGMEETGQTKL